MPDLIVVGEFVSQIFSLLFLHLVGLRFNNHHSARLNSGLFSLFLFLNDSILSLKIFCCFPHCCLEMLGILTVSTISRLFFLSRKMGTRTATRGSKHSLCFVFIFWISSYHYLVVMEIDAGIYKALPTMLAGIFAIVESACSPDGSRPWRLQFVVHFLEFIIL